MRPPPTAAGRLLDPAQVRAQPTRSGDDLLRLVPGLVVSRHGGEGKAPQLFLRGFDAEHGADLEVLLEGVPLNERSNVHGNGYLDLGVVLPEAVRQVEVLRGPFELGQGAFGTAGTLRLHVGVAEEDVGTRAGLEFGTTGRARALLLHAGGPRDVLAAEALHDEGYGPGRKSERAAVLGQWTLREKGPVRLSLMGAALAARFGDPGVAPLPDVEAQRLGFYDTWTRGHGTSLRALLSPALEWTRGEVHLRVRGWGAARALSLEHDYTGFLLDPVRGDRRRQTHQAFGGGLRAEGEGPVGPLTAVAGATWMGESLSRSEQRLGSDGEPFATNAEAAGPQHALGTHLGLRARPWRPLRLQAGARADVFHGGLGGGTSAVLSPRATAQLQVATPLTLFAGAGRGVRPPDAAQPRPVAVDSAEVGARVAWPVLMVDVAAFGAAIEDELRFDHLSGTTIAQGPSRRLGVDAGLHLYPLSWLELRADVSLVRARLLDEDRPVPGAPSLSGSAFAVLVHPDGWRGGGRFTFVGERPLAHGAVAAGYAVLDLQAGYRFRSAELFVALDNVTGARFREGEYHYPSWFDTTRPRSELPQRHFSPGHPRALRAGVTFLF